MFVWLKCSSFIVAKLTSKWHGESPKLCKMLFEVAVAIKPCIIIFDEMEDLCGKRDGNSDNSQLSMKTTLLSELQDIKRDPEIHFIGTTNRVGKYQHINSQMLLHICLGVISFFFFQTLWMLPSCGELNSVFMLVYQHNTKSCVCWRGNYRCFQTHWATRKWRKLQKLQMVLPTVL